MKAYFDKGRVSPLLEDVPLLAVMVEDLGVRGARKNAEIVRCFKYSELNILSFWFSYQFHSHGKHYFVCFYFLATHQEHAKYEDYKFAIVNRATGNTPEKTHSEDSSDDPLAERLRKIEKDSAASKTLSMISTAVAVGLVGVMALTKSK